jgi:general stress protein YciG
LLICWSPCEETDDVPVDDGKDPAAKAMGKKGGTATAKSLTAERRQEIARKGRQSVGNCWNSVGPEYFSEYLSRQLVESMAYHQRNLESLGCPLAQWMKRSTALEVFWTILIR